MFDANNRRLENGTFIANRYEVIDTLGVGGMGTVVKVLDHTLDGEICALKILNCSLAQDQTLFGRFKNEVILARKLSHPHIVLIYDFGGAGKGAYYISMQFVEGGTLTQRIYDREYGRMNFEDQVKIILQISDGLASAHKKGVIHRDLKPDNILLDQKESVKISDFGLARSLEINKDFTLTGETVGTPHYMCPEQLAGEELDGRADIYSLGIIAYEMAARKRPFISNNYLDLARMHIDKQIPDVTEINKEVPRWYRDFIYIAASKHKADRFQSGVEAIQYLNENLEKSGSRYRQIPASLVL